MPDVHLAAEACVCVGFWRKPNIQRIAAQDDGVCAQPCKLYQCKKPRDKKLLCRAWGQERDTCDQRYCTGNHTAMLATTQHRAGAERFYGEPPNHPAAGINVFENHGHYHGRKDSASDK